MSIWSCRPAYNSGFTQNSFFSLTFLFSASNSAIVVLAVVVFCFWPIVPSDLPCFQITQYIRQHYYFYAAWNSNIVQFSSFSLYFRCNIKRLPAWFSCSVWYGALVTCLLFRLNSHCFQVTQCICYLELPFLLQMVVLC